MQSVFYDILEPKVEKPTVSPIVPAIASVTTVPEDVATIALYNFEKFAI